MVTYRRVSLKSIDEFKWHTKIIKTFGKKALIIYTAFPRTGADVDESTINGLLKDEQQRNEIMKFMIDNGLIEVSEGAPAAKPEARKAAKPAPPPEEETPEEEIQPEIEEEKEEEMAPPKEKPKARKPPKEEEVSISYEPSKEEAPEEEIQPEIEEEKEEEIVPPKEKPKAKKPPKEEEIEPEEEAPEEEAPPAEIEEIRPEGEEAEEEEKEEKPNLTPAEMIVHDRYGDLGVAIFRLIDGKRSVAEVAKESGTSQEKVMEILKYLDEVGLISLGGGAEETKGGATQPAEEKFAPLSEESELSTISIDEQKEGIKIVKLAPSNIMSNMKINVSVVFKYGKSGRMVFEYINSKKEANTVTLAIKLNIPIGVVEDIVNFLKSQNYVELSLMGREEIKKAFGYDAYIIYKRYGKKGVIFYEIIDKDIPLKQIAELISERDSSRIIEIFKLIRDVLGIDLPINEDAIKRELVF